MTTSPLYELLPELYRDLLPEPLGREAPEERLATCANCAMAPDADCPGGSGGYHFLPETKCCTFSPFLPSYLLGGLFSDPDPALDEGRRRVRDRMAKRVRVSPAGVGPTEQEVLLSARGGTWFGQNTGLVCPYLSEGNCSIWKHRDATCSTYFCKHVAGRDGQLLAVQLKAAMQCVERALSLHVLIELGLDPALIELREVEKNKKLVGPKLEGLVPDDTAWAAMWQDWTGREEAFYVEAHEIVRGLSPEDVARIGGAELRGQLIRLEEARKRTLTARRPERVRVNPRMAIVPQGERRLITSYAGTDPRSVPAKLLSVLYHFDDVSIEEGQRRIEAARGRPLRDGLIDQLLHMRVLIHADAEPPEI